MKFYVSLGCLTATSATAFARQVDLQAFLDPLSAMPTALSSDSPSSVAAKMAETFGGRFSPQPLLADGIQQDLAATFSPDRGDCSPSAYTRTWWLSKEVERRRAAYYPLVVEISCKFRLSPALLDAVIAQESGYNSFAVSSAGAMGMMQIMPGTARQLGLTSPWDLIANMTAGARYLRQQIDRFGRIDLALAAYNAGPKRSSLNLGYVPKIPETMNYVRTITTNWARLTQLTPALPTMTARAEAANLAVRAAGYREVTLSVYEGINAENPI